jgi:hypothetical protein
MHSLAKDVLRSIIAAPVVVITVVDRAEQQT